MLWTYASKYLDKNFTLRFYRYVCKCSNSQFCHEMPISINILFVHAAPMPSPDS